MTYNASISKPGFEVFAMETVMHKHPTYLTTFHADTAGPAKSWYSALKDWREVRRLRKDERKHRVILSQLTPSILYDIGESDCRLRPTGSGIWDNNPYRLLIDAMTRRNPSEFDPRR
jgi:hypothetical protein